MDKTRYTHYQINYHFVWIPKYRRRVLVGSVKDDLEEGIRVVCSERMFRIISLEVMPDHVHLFLSAPPRYSPSMIINSIKGATSKRLRGKYSHLKRMPSLWTRTYYVGTAGNMSADTIRRYIEEQQGT